MEGAIVYRSGAVLRGFKMLVAAAVMAPVLLFGVIAAHDRVRLLDELARTARGQTEILHQHALNVFQTHSLAAERIADRLAGMDWDEIARSDPLKPFLQAIHGNYPPGRCDLDRRSERSHPCQQLTAMIGMGTWR